MQRVYFVVFWATICGAGFLAGRFLLGAKETANQHFPRQSVEQSAPVPSSASTGSFVVKNTTNSMEAAGTVRAARVIDGDTIVLDNNERVRYIGMDAPEIGTHIRNTSGRDTGESSDSARSKDEDVSIDTLSPQRRSDAQDSPHPEGLRGFSRPAALRLGRSAKSTALSASLADTGKSPATRPGGISNVGSDPRKPVQCFGRESASRNRELVEGKLVRLEKDVSERDKYRRLLRYVFLSDGTFVNLELVKEGYATAFTYPPDVAHANDFVVAEREAREAKRGLWSACKNS